MQKNKPTDVQLVHKASSWLEISEFQVFSDAWRDWFHEEPGEKRIESFFVDFLDKGEVPFWVRSYVRLVLKREDLLAKEKKRLIIGTLTYYVPLLIFFLIIMWAYFH